MAESSRIAAARRRSRGRRERRRASRAARHGVRHGTGLSVRAPDAARPFPAPAARARHGQERL